MTDPAKDPLATILRLCEEAAPSPWYPKTYAETTGILRDSLDPHLDQLRMGGLIHLTDWVQGQGQGYALTPEGAQVLHSPRALARLQAGKLLPRPDGVEASLSAVSRPATAFERGEVVRGALLHPSPPVVTYVLLFANLLVFLYGLVLALQKNIDPGAYIFNSHPVILRATGAVSAADMVAGQWWRLLSACFVHIGIIHLAVNMYTLYAVGPMVEQMWGRGRFLALYLIAGLGGSCAQLIFSPFRNLHPISLAGASGALWGMMASMAIWIILNRNYLPRPLTSAWLRQLLTVFVLNTFISMMPGIGAAAHFGGGAVGALAGVLLNEHRFRHGLRRGLALIGVLALPMLCLGALLQEMATDLHWQTYIRQQQGAILQEPRADDDREPRVDSQSPSQRAQREVQEAYQQARALFGQDPPQRDPAAVDQATAALEKAQAHLTSTTERLRKLGSYRDKRQEKVRRLYLEHLETQAQLFRALARCLRKGSQCTPAEEDEVERLQHQVRQIERDLQPSSPR
jgi:rhomboid protease GluP